MSEWSCSACGSANPEPLTICEICGGIRFAHLVLAGDEGQMQIACNLAVGRSHYRQLCGDDSKYAHATQFHCIFCTEKGCWTLQLEPQANNPTWHNGETLGDTITLKNGDVITIGPEKAPLTVSILYKN